MTAELSSELIGLPGRLVAGVGRETEQTLGGVARAGLRRGSKPGGVPAVPERRWPAPLA